MPDAVREVKPPEHSKPAARLLRTDYTALPSKMKRYGISARDFPLLTCRGPHERGDRI